MARNDESSTPAVSVSDLNPQLRRTLHRLCSDKRAIREQIGLLESEDKELSEKIKDIAEENHLEKVRGEGWQLLKTSRVVKTINAEKLMSLGVDIEIILAATDVRVSEGYQVRGSK